jgi:hypothetical protein
VPCRAILEFHFFSENVLCLLSSYGLIFSNFLLSSPNSLENDATSRGKKGSLHEDIARQYVAQYKPLRQLSKVDG